MVKKSVTSSIVEGNSYPENITAGAESARLCLRKARMAGQRNTEEMNGYLIRAINLAHWVAGNTTSPAQIEAMEGILREAQRIQERAHGIKRKGKGGH